jgi:hypothetical protein
MKTPDIKTPDIRIGIPEPNGDLFQPPDSLFLSNRKCRYVNNNHSQLALTALGFSPVENWPKFKRKFAFFLKINIFPRDIIYGRLS